MVLGVIQGLDIEPILAQMKITEENSGHGEAKRELGVSVLYHAKTRRRRYSGCCAVGGTGMLGANVHCLDAYKKETLEDDWLSGLSFRPQVCVSKGFQ